MTLPIGSGYNLEFYLDEQGNPVFAATDKKVEDPNLLGAIQKMLDEMEEKSAFTLQVGSQVLKYILNDDGKPVTLKDHQEIDDPVLTLAIQKDMELRQSNGTLKDDAGSVADKFKGLPMRELISAPLLAAAEAQEELASTAWDFYQRIAFFEKDAKDLPEGCEPGGTRILKFKVQRPVQDGDSTTMVDQEIQAPFIGLVPVPSLLIDRIDVDFQMEVTDTETTKTNTQAEVSTSISSNWFVKAQISGKVSTSRENTRSTNQTAKYQVHVSASQQPQTEGLSKLMDIMASCIEPIKNSNTPQPSPTPTPGT